MKLKFSREKPFDNCLKIKIYFKWFHHPTYYIYINIFHERKD